MQCSCTQHFGENANPSYVEGGLKGHTGVDVACGFGTPIYSKYAGYIVKVIDNKNTFANDGSHYTMVSMLVDDRVECFEWQIGHLDPCIAAGQFIDKGTLIGYEANHGTVYAVINGQLTLVTEAMRNAGSQAGAHRHCQKRGLIPIIATKLGQQYLSSQSMSPWYNNGNYYQYAEPNNGFNSCLDPLAPVFSRYLTYGMSGYDVFVLQRILRNKGFLSAEATGYFGVLTLAALMAWQRANGLTPAPIFGPKSRQLALQQCGPLPDLLGN